MSISNAFVEIQNFKSIEKRKVQLEKGVTLLKGASGAGKSTTLESVLYAITGAPRTCKSMDRPTASTQLDGAAMLEDDEQDMKQPAKRGRHEDENDLGEQRFQRLRQLEALFGCSATVKVTNA